MIGWDISEEALGSWCRDILRRYSPEDVALFLIRLKRTYDTRHQP